MMAWMPTFMAGYPVVAELDLAGVVADGNGSEFNIGDRVHGVIDMGKSYCVRLSVLSA